MHPRRLPRRSRNQSNMQFRSIRRQNLRQWRHTLHHRHHCPQKPGFLAGSRGCLAQRQPLCPPLHQVSDPCQKPEKTTDPQTVVRATVPGQRVDATPGATVDVMVDVTPDVKADARTAGVKFATAVTVRAAKATGVAAVGAVAGAAQGGIARIALRKEWRRDKDKGMDKGMD